MSSDIIYYKLQLLKTSNKNLLDLYYSLYEKLDGKESEFQRQAISARLGCRERFRLELMQCIDDNFACTEDSFLDTVGHYYLPQMKEVENHLKNLFAEESWERCEYYEVRNLNTYHNLLHFPGLDPSITDLLLKQKNCVEEFLLCPAEVTSAKAS